MGVIKKILHRSNPLGKPRFRNLFLDMEENIHIHYRDLRIELSRGEFEDFAAAFNKQSEELLGIIHEKSYQDGKLPNANQEDVRIWTESRLKHEVKYHPTRFSLEECGDGYHFHFRNYKLLLDPAEFRQITDLFKSLNLDAPYATSYEEVLELLEANDVDFTLDAGNVPGEVLALSVAQYHVPKVRDIFGYIDFPEEVNGLERSYQGKRLKVVVKPDKQRTALDFRRLREFNAAVRLVDFLTRHAGGFDPDKLNRIKCQVIDLYSALKAGQRLTVETDPQLWLYVDASTQVIFPYSSAVRGGEADAEGLYKAWSQILSRLGLGFIKPGKDVFPSEHQKLLRQQIEEAIRKEAAAFRAVEKVYWMGSVKRSDMGRYRAPFVHGKLVKLGSDVDILIEIDPEREADIPASWHLINKEASNHCAVYHLAEVPLHGGFSEMSAQYPNIRFTEHLLDAYVHFPSHGFTEEKDAFLSKFGAQLIYDRSRDGVFFYGEEESRISTRLAELYGFSRAAVERMKVSTENAIFLVFVEGADYVLKLFKVAGNYHRNRVVEHTDYEERLVTALLGQGVNTAAVVPTPQGMDTTIEVFPALLFERIPGKVQQRPEYPLERICSALARIHRVQLEHPLDLPVTFTFDDSCMIWLPWFHNTRQDSSLETDIAEAFTQLAPLADSYSPGEVRAALFARSPGVHCHGDVTPKNVIVGETGEACFFDFNNAFFGPRMVDVIDGAFEFSLAEKYIHLADFARFDAFIDHYSASCPLTDEERADLIRWIELIGVIKFAKEVRVLMERPDQMLRRQRALAIAGFVKSRRNPA